MTINANAECDTLIRYEGRDGWGNLQHATYPCPAGATPPREIKRFGCTLKRVDQPRSPMFDIAVAITNVAIAAHGGKRL